MPNDERVPLTTKQVALYSSVAGFVAGVIALTLFAAGVKSEAHEAKCGVDDLSPRVNTLEKHEAEDRADFRSSMKMMEEVRGDVKKILERMPR